MPPKRKVAAAKVNKDASPSKITKDEKTEETPKPSEAESATEKLCSSQSEMASPEQDRTGETVTIAAEGGGRNGREAEAEA